MSVLSWFEEGLFILGHELGFKFIFQNTNITIIWGKSSED